MDLTKFTGNLNNIQSLPNKPALSPEDLKKEFDKGNNALKDFINSILITELISILTQLEKDIESGESSVKTINNTITTMKTKLDGIATGANKYVHPTTAGNKHIPAGGASGKILKWGGSDGTAIWETEKDTTYGAATTTKNGLMSATDKTKLNGIATNANNYSHPTGAGNKHIPSGGAAGQVLKYKSNGEAQWANEKDTTYGNATTSASGLMSASDKTKLNGIANGATKVVISRGTSAPSGGSNGDYYLQYFT